VRERSLGETSVTAVGLGDVRLATAASRGLDSRDVERALHQALQLGITLVDVADEDDAERLCGEAIRTLRMRDRVVVATRVPVLAERPGAPKRDVLPERLPAGYVQQRVESSLRTTRLDALPLVQLAIRVDWCDSTAWPELAGTCARLVREGKVRQWAVSVDELEGAERLARETWLAGVAAPFNACERAAEPLLDAKLVVLARRPLAGAALAGTLGPGVQLPPRDDRNTIDARMLERIAVAAARLAALVRKEPPAARSCDAAREAREKARRPSEVDTQTVAELALRYVIDRGAIALPRLHRHEHIADAIAAALAPPLSAELRARIDEIFTA
jgi:aryl-alcohol dehydrogenase-like predicted oxidoreductase